MKNKGSSKRFDCYIKPFSIFLWYILTPFLQVVTSVVFSKYLGSLVTTTVGFKLKYWKKKYLHFAKKLVVRKEFFGGHEKNVLLFEKFFWSKHFPPSTSNRKLQKDKSVVKVFTKAFHKSKLNPLLTI